MLIDKEWVEGWVDAINGDDSCQNNGRQFSDSITLAIGDSRYTFKILSGKIEHITRDGGPLVGSVFTLAADTDVWGKLFLPSPPAMYHDIFSLIAIGEMKFEGNIQLVFQQLSTLAEWVRVGRELNGEIEIPPDPEYLEEWQAVGRYTNVVVDGCRHKVFYFEAGEGIPVICQHTAGNENRQWRYLLEDRELTKKYKFYAYDLPSHGKSDPPFEKNFFGEDHLLRSAWATDFVVNFAKSLKLERPIFIGCSIGGVIALHLAERFPEFFRGFIALAGATPTYGFYHDWWIDPKVNTIMTNAGLVDSVMPPKISRWDRQINRMCQTAHPRSLRNDLHLWGVENSDEKRAERIDASKVPIYMYSGEFDFTCPPEHVEKSAKAIGEVNYEMLEGLGHFPMSENYDIFRPTLIRTLEDIVDITG